MAKTKKAAKKPAAKKMAAKKPSKPAAKKAKAPAKAKTSAKSKTAKKPAAKAAPKKATKPVAKVNQKKAVTKSSQSAKPVAKATASKNLQNFVTPLDDRLIVEMASSEKITAGGLYIPETSNVTGQFKGTVVAAGRGHRDPKGRVRPMDVKTGDTVLFADFSGTKITLLGNDYRIMRESEILGIVENN